MGSLINTLTRIMPLALGIIGVVEKLMGAGKGPEKRAAYIDGLMVALGVTENLANKDIVDDVKFKELLGKIADDVIAVNNFIRDYKK